MYFKSSILALLAVCCQISCIMASINVSPYHASYNVQVLRPISAKGTVTNTFSQIDKETYQLTEQMQGKGILGFALNKILQKEGKNYSQSIFKIVDTDVTPIEYIRGNETLNIQNDTVCPKNDNKNCETSPNHTKIYDPYSVQIQYKLYLEQKIQNNHADPITYAVKDNSINLTTFTTDTKSQTISLNDKTYQTIQVTVSEQGKNRHTIFWLSPTIHYAPVKIERYKNNKKTMVITLTSYKTL